MLAIDILQKMCHNIYAKFTEKNLDDNYGYIYHRQNS